MSAHFTPICVACAREMRCKKNDYVFADYGKAAIWAGDMYECPQCKAQIITGFGKEPIAIEQGPEFKRYLIKTQLTLDK